MDEIEYKIKTNNSVLIVNAIDKLISSIKSKYKPTERQKFVLENEELKYLREKCLSENTLVSLTAYQGLLALVELGVLEIGHTMSTVITLIPSAHNYSATISTMAGLLVLDLRSRLIPGQVYKCQFSLKSPKHPLISVLEKNKDAEDDVLAQMHALCTHPEYKISTNSLELLRSVFFWLTCNPQWTSKNIRPWQLLLSLPQTTAQTSLLLNCISYQQICNPKQSERAFAAYSGVVDAAMYQQRREYLVAFLPMLARISNEMLKQGRDPRACYSLMERCFALDAPELRNVAGLTLFLLAENLNYTTALYLHELFNLALNIITKYDCPSICVNSFAALSLQWLKSPSHLTTSALVAASKFLEASRTPKETGLNAPNLRANPAFQTFVYTDAALGTVFKFTETWERIQDSQEVMLSWLTSLTDAVKLQLAPFIVGLLLERDRFEPVTLEAARILARLVDLKRDLSVMVLPVLQYVVANDARPGVRLECLRALPLMAKTKENVPTIVSILNKLKVNKGVPTSFLIMLYTTLAEMQVRCFPYLQELLVEARLGRPTDLQWEIDVAKAYAVKRICELRPSSHGLELVGVISAILNKCTDKASSSATCFALEALGALWKGAAVAAPSTWRALEPRLGKDSKPAVQIGLCRLLALVPSLRTASPEYARLVQEASTRLWRHVADAHQPLLAAAACDALAEFRIEDFRLADLPEIYRQTVKLPPSYCKTPADAARKPEEVLDYIPCEVWPEVFRCSNQACAPAVGRVASGLIRRELAAFRSGVYSLAGRGEGAVYAHLPAASVARGLFDALRKQVLSPSYEFPEEAVLSILETLGADHQKPLPPVDITFLQDAMLRSGRWRRGCFNLVARQAQVSPSARKMVDKFLLDVQYGKGEDADTILIFECLPILCRGMPPNSLRGPIEQCLSVAFKVLPKGRVGEMGAKGQLGVKGQLGAKGPLGAAELEMETPIFIQQLNHIENCLQCDNIHEANRTLLSQFVESYFSVVTDDSVAWEAYVSCCRRLGASYLERMTSPSGWWEVTAPLVRRACGVRAALAADSECKAPLPWLNEFVDACATQITEQEYSLRCMVAALRRADPDADSTKEWFLQLMGRTQAAFKETDVESSNLYLIDVLMLSVVAFSGLWSLEPEPDSVVGSRASRQALLPFAAAVLAGRPSWGICTLHMLEWLCHSRCATNDKATAQSCQRALLALRHTEQFATHHIWTRLESHFAINDAANADD